MAKRGGKRPGAGRKKGAVAMAKRQLSEMAKDYAESALQTLVEIHQNKGSSDAARVSAAVAILDRGYGKPSQAMTISNPDGSNVMPTEIRIVPVAAKKRGDS